MLAHSLCTVKLIKVSYVWIWEGDYPAIQCLGNSGWRHSMVWGRSPCSVWSVIPSVPCLGSDTQWEGKLKTQAKTSNGAIWWWASQSLTLITKSSSLCIWVDQPREEGNKCSLLGAGELGPRARKVLTLNGSNWVQTPATKKMSPSLTRVIPEHQVRSKPWAYNWVWLQNEKTKHNISDQVKFETDGLESKDYYCIVIYYKDCLSCILLIQVQIPSTTYLE